MNKGENVPNQILLLLLEWKFLLSEAKLVLSKTHSFNGFPLGSIGLETDCFIVHGNNHVHK